MTDMEEKEQDLGRLTPNADYYRSTFLADSQKLNNDTADMFLSLATRPSMDKMPNVYEPASA